MVEALDVSADSIVGYNTDAIKVRGGYKVDSIREKTARDEPGQYRMEDCALLTGRTMEEQERFPEYIYEPVNVVTVPEAAADVKRLLTTGGVATGVAGCGKTEFIKTLLGALSEEERKSTAVLAYTNKSSRVLCQRLKDFDAIKHTVNSMLWNGSGLSVEPLKNVKRIILDEFGMLPPAEMSMILKAHEQFGTVIICLGDLNQCKAPVDNWVLYDQNPVFLKMCGSYHVKMECKPGYSRYDTELLSSLTNFLETVRLDWECGSVETYQNICYTNERMAQINRECFNRWVVENKATVINFGFPMCVGMPVMAYHNADKELGIYKTEVWTVKSVSSDRIYLERDGREVYLDKTQFTSIFNYAFCITAHKSQSMAMDAHFNIYEAERMPKDVLYTAMSRGRKREYVHLATKSDKVYKNRTRAVSVACDYKPVELRTARIYRINFQDGSAYIGKTINTLEQRLAEHKAKPTNEAMAEALKVDATIELLQEFRYRREAEVLTTEQIQIARAHATGVRLLNKQHGAKPLEQARKQVEAKAPRVTIREDAEKKRFVIELRRKNVDDADKVARFP